MSAQQWELSWLCHNSTEKCFLLFYSYIRFQSEVSQSSGSQWYTSTSANGTIHSAINNAINNAFNSALSNGLNNQNNNTPSETSSPLRELRQEVMPITILKLINTKILSYTVFWLEGPVFLLQNGNWTCVSHKLQCL